MKHDDAKSVILQLLKRNGRATNQQMIRAIDGDKELFAEVRSELILEDIAKDKDGVGLINTYIEVEPEINSSPRVEIGTTETSRLHQNNDGRTKQLGIFISYGRVDASDLATQLETDLIEKGYRVWLDKKQIRGGAFWEEQIELAIHKHENFICLLTPHAVGRPDGVCLDEISVARYNGRRIIPAMVIMCRPPLGIYRLDWLDFQDWRNPASYQQAFQRLIATIESNTAVEGIHARIFSTLKPLDFSAEISRYTRDYTGREWLFAELEEWLENNISRVFFITGDPGTGKSAVISRLVQKHPQVVAYHYCVSSFKDSSNPILFVHSIAAQLATQLENYRNALEAINLENITEADPSSLFRRLIVDLLKFEKPTRPLLIFVDALDEAFQYSYYNIAKVLRDRLNDLPPWIRLVLSSRKEPAILDLFSEFNPHEIDAARTENLIDISDYLHKKFNEPVIQETLERAEVDPKATADLIIRESEGNFLYVTQVVAAIRSGQIDPSLPQSFPSGLVGFYQSFFERIFPHGNGYDKLYPILNVIVVAREPLTADRIAEFVAEDPDQIESKLEKIAAFFPKRNDHYQAYHKSIIDWLKGSIGYGRTYCVNIREGHHSIARKLLDGYISGVYDRFTLAHLPAHLIGAQCWHDLETILTDLAFIAAKCGAGMTYDLVADYATALDNLPEAQREKHKEIDGIARISKYTNNLTHYARREISHLEIIPSVKPWSKNKIRKDTERIIADPKRLDKIRAFSQFVNSESDALVRFASQAEFCIQQAYNSAGAGPVARTAEIRLNTKIDDILILHRPSERYDFNPHPALIRTIKGHTDLVFSVSITPDGKLAISGSRDNTLRLWDLESGECLRTLPGHIGWVRSVCITLDGKRAISGSRDCTLRLWDLDRGQCISILKGHKHFVESVRITPDGSRAISGSGDNTIRIWDLESSECLAVLYGHEGWIYGLSVTPDGKKAVSGSYDNTVRIWDLEQKVCLHTINENLSNISLGSISSISMTPDGRRAVWGGSDHALKLWDLEKGESLKTLPGHSAWVRSVDMTPDGKLAISASSDNTLRVWDTDNGECLRILQGHTNIVRTVSITPDGKRAVSGSDDFTLRVWNLESGECGREIETRHRVWDVSITPDGKRAISAGSDNNLRIWDLINRDCLRILPGHSDWVRSTSVTPDGTRVVSASSDNTLRIWELDSGKNLKILEGHKGWVNCVRISTDGLWAISGSYDGTLRIWDLRSGECVRLIEDFHKVWTVSMTPDGKRIITGGYDRKINIWDFSSGDFLGALSGHSDWIRSVSITPNGKSAISASSDSTLRIWDLRSGKCLNIMEGHTGWVRCVSTTIDGNRAVSVSQDDTLRIWDLDSGECIAIYNARNGTVSVSGFRSNGLLVYGTEVGTIIPLIARNLPLDPPTVTSVRIVLYTKKIRWDYRITALCEWCGQRFPVSQKILTVIRAINCDANVTPDQSPCLELPSEVWNEPLLLSECPLCHQPLKFNPFIVDDRGRY